MSPIWLPRGSLGYLQSRGTASQQSLHPFRTEGLNVLNARIGTNCEQVRNMSLLERVVCATMHGIESERFIGRTNIVKMWMVDFSSTGHISGAFYFVLL